MGLKNICAVIYTCLSEVVQWRRDQTNDITEDVDGKGEDLGKCWNEYCRI